VQAFQESDLGIGEERERRSYLKKRGSKNIDARTQFKESSNIPSLSPPDQGISFSFIGSVRILGKGGVARPLLRMRKDYPKEMYRSINDDERLS